MAGLRVRYQTIEFGEMDIHVCTLRDRQEYADTRQSAHELGISSSQWSLFGVIWPSSERLAILMAEIDIVDRRILEVGCGIALSSLVLNHRSANITATDYHPEVDLFLQRNALLNKDELIPFVRTDWNDPKSDLGTFDLIIGSDLLYEDEHPAQLSAFIGRHAATACEVIMIDPGRGRRGIFSRNMLDLGFHREQVKSNDHTTMRFQKEA